MALTCEVCEQKMKCAYSIPVGAKMTFRAYKCLECRNYMETVELPCGLFENLREFDHLELLRRVRGARAKKAAMSRVMKKGPPMAAVPFRAR